MAIMSEEIESLNDKINSLEDMLDSMESQLIAADDRFQQSLVAKSSLENANLDLMSEVSKLRLELSQCEISRIVAEDKARTLESELAITKSVLLERETELSSLRLTLAKMARTTGYLLTETELSLLKGKSFSNDLRNRTQSPESRVTDKPPLPVHQRPLPDTPSQSEPASRRESTLCGRQSPASSTLHRVNPPNSGNTSPMSSMARSSSAENVKPNQTPIANYSTLPHLRGPNVLQKIQHDLQQNDMNSSFGSDDYRSNSVSNFYNRSNDNLKSKDGHSSGKSGFVSFAKENQIISSTRSSNSEIPNSIHSLTYGPAIKSEHKPKGLKRIFSRAKRTPSISSGLSDNTFHRGGFRSTSGPRLGYSASLKKTININLPFSRWDTNLVAEWFAVIGLGMYSNDCKRWCKNGEHLMRATAQEIEKELGIRNALHRKKLRLAVSAMNQEIDELTKSADQLDYLWVARWLDDIGLPQYKDIFLDARIDGRVLHYLTVEDLFSLKITSQLHHVSIRAGIKLLREQKFDPQCLKRRAAPEEANVSEWKASEIVLWTSHRVMEWLRSIDLSEYAPNLRGSGVHGALIVYEPAFNADLFATLLSIPQGKTLLRRHISIKFKQLIGNDLCRAKRDFESRPNYVPMIPGAKIKPYKRGHFSLIKKRKSDIDFEEYVCPMTDTSTIGSQTPSLRSFRREDSFSSTNSTQSNATDGQQKDRATDV